MPHRGPNSGDLTVGDLFSGAGGLSLGFRRAGFESLWTVDSSKAAAATFENNLLGTAVCKEIKADFSFPRPTVIVVGPPCQGFFSAGMRNAGDDRNTLVSVFAEIVKRIRPVAFVFENVEGSLTVGRGARVYELLHPLVTAGYRVHVRKVNAANFGVPQHRKRELAIGGHGFDPTFPSPTHRAFGAPGAGRSAPWLRPTGTVEDAISDLPPAARSAPGSPSNHYSSLLGEKRLARVKALRTGQTMRDLPMHLWHPSYRRRAFRRVLDGTPTEKRGGAPAAIRRLEADQPSKAITGGAIGEFVHPSQNRFLMLRECARIQTYPDDFVFHGTRSERAGLIGNAVPPRLARSVASCLARDLGTRKREFDQGQLLSFLAEHKHGASPALQRVTEMIESEFHLRGAKLGCFRCHSHERGRRRLNRLSRNSKV